MMKTLSVLLNRCVWFFFFVFSNFSLFGQIDVLIDSEGTPVLDSVELQIQEVDKDSEIQTTIPYGVWEVAQVTVDKTTNGKVERAAYNRNVKVQSYVSCPQTWEIIDSNSILLRYSDGIEERAKYTITDDQLNIDIAVAMLSYQYRLNDETLILRTTHYYQNNLHRGSIDHIEETWTIDLRKYN